MKKKNIAHIGTCSAILALLFGAGLGLCLLFGAAAQLVIWMK